MNAPRNISRDFGLLRRVGKNAASILCARIATLAILGSGVVHAVEELEEGGVGDFGGIKNDL